MKINVPVVVREQVGTTFTADRYYDDPQRPNIYGIEKPLHELKVQFKTAFDYDFQAVRRLAASSRLVALATTLVALSPVILAYVAGEVVGKGIEFICEKAGAGLEAIGAQPGWTLTESFKTLAKDIVR